MAANAKKIMTGDLTSAEHRRPGSANLITPWQPGQSGNPAGRPKGARSKLTELALTSLLQDFEQHGAGVIEEVRKKSPSHYLAAIVSLMPKQQEKIESPFSDLSDEELHLLEQFLKSARAHPVIEVQATNAETLDQEQTASGEGEKD